MTPNQYKTQLWADIQKTINETKGGAKTLSVKLGKSKSYVSKVLERNNTSGLIKLWNLIKNEKP